MEVILEILRSVWAIFIIVLFLGGSIFVHELGHFLAARRRGLKIERFSIGFGPRIYGWRGKDGVEYRISWLPFGGYVALPQLADLRLIEGDAEVDVAALPPITYGTKVLVFAAGAVFNLIFAFILATVLWMIGRPEPEYITSTTVGYVVPKMVLPDKTEIESPAAKAGLRPGDIIRAVDGRTVRDWPSMQSALVLGTRVDERGDRLTVLSIERDGVIRDFPVTPVRLGEENFRRIGVSAAFEPIIMAVAPGSSAAQLGFAKDDRLVTIDGARLYSLEYLFQTVAASADGVRVGVQRGDANLEFKLPKLVAGQPHPLRDVTFTAEWALRYQTPTDQFAHIFQETLRTIRTLVHPRGDVPLAALSSPIGIARNFWAAAKSEYPVHFSIWLAVLVNVSLAIFNLLPIPVLDGGHIALATIAKLRGRPLPPNFILTTQSVFIVLLCAMMLYVAVFGDLRRMVNEYNEEAAARAQAEKDKQAEPAKP